jgi:hypothetical protein
VTTICARLLNALLKVFETNHDYTHFDILVTFPPSVLLNGVCSVYSTVEQDSQ